MKAFLVILSALFWSFVGACCSGDPLWHREGGTLNPWGGDFLGLKSAWKRQEIKRIEQDWGFHKPRQQLQ